MVTGSRSPVELEDACGLGLYFSYFFVYFLLCFGYTGICPSDGQRDWLSASLATFNAESVTRCHLAMSSGHHESTFEGQEYGPKLQYTLLP